MSKYIPKRPTKGSGFRIQIVSDWLIITPLNKKKRVEKMATRLLLSFWIKRYNRRAVNILVKTAKYVNLMGSVPNMDITGMSK
jgi:hypothetical protein